MTPLVDFLTSVVGVVLGTWLYHAWRDRSTDGDPRWLYRARVSETPSEDPRTEEQ
ncbi:hypothetical protein [Halobacterium sp. CBA1126]|uniref:hypothetical protein n=1 Tax=Halobacterium sp. CBA1126 TaxID=2668074 RepID=UPI0012F74867|nr:hypothetical protein [Halobacterium sp. CBA1126]MUV59980.1 hypothetical protein [Halobacterium sp. CBA1126]